ncbi:MAG: ABC transporter ATP-binding protein [Candidatus Bipolaricaulis sp.]|nr:ABC transporter ATP-binding protein [Candidatus Bipolaricaulis sp.]
MSCPAVGVGVERLLDVSDLTVRFDGFQGVVHAVEGVEFDISSREVVGLIGETGCGKSVTGFSLVRLIQPPGRVVRGRVLLRGRDLLTLSERELRRVRGRDVAMIFQRPMSSLNPVFDIETQLLEIIQLHRVRRRTAARRIAIESLAAVALPDPQDILKKRPFELSGGMQQRVMIALALACNSALLIADEPTTALDVSIQLQILKLIRGIVDERGMSVLLISHDMSVIGSMCDRINVMYAGSIVEAGDQRTIIRHAAHPYSQALLRAVPEGNATQGVRLVAIDGTVPSLITPPPGCRFAPRCSEATDVCTTAPPPRVQVSPAHSARCFHIAEPAAGSGTEGRCVQDTEKRNSRNPNRKEMECSTKG